MAERIVAIENEMGRHVLDAPEFRETIRTIQRDAVAQFLDDPEVRRMVRADVSSDEVLRAVLPRLT